MAIINRKMYSTSKFTPLIIVLFPLLIPPNVGKKLSSSKSFLSVLLQKLSCSNYQAKSNYEPGFRIKLCTFLTSDS